MPSGVFILPRLKLRIPNITVREGSTAFLKMMFQDDQIILPGAGNFFIGLCGETGVSDTATLSDLDEVATLNGYARQPIARNTTGWPTMDIINSQSHAKSAIVTFTATGSDFTSAYSRIFLCNVVSGTVGTLFVISGKIDPAIIVSPGAPEQIQYEYYW